MYRRGRPGRERSRDPSRPFPPVRDRDRDRDDSRYRERQPGPWGEDLDRRGEERRRDERSNLPPLPPHLPVGPLLGPGHLPEPPNFTRDASKGPNARRGSRDSTREIPPQDPARRHSGGTPSLAQRKEFSEPSPRERGMIGDPGVPPRRQLSGNNWPGRDRDDERPRSNSVRSRKNSLDRVPDHLSHSPIESPRSFIPPPSPTASISTPATNMAPSAPFPPAGNHSITAAENKNFIPSRIFQEASYAYTKYLEAQSNWKTADKERNDHAEHFNAFPALKDRYEGNAKAAKKELTSATETLNKKSAVLDRFCNKLVEDRLSRDADSAIEFCDKIRKELGNSNSITQFVRSAIPAPIPAPSKEEFHQLQSELREMKRKQEEDEKMRQNFAKEFINYKNEQTNRQRNQDAKLNRFETVQSELRGDIERVKDDHRIIWEDLKKTIDLLTTTQNRVEKLDPTKNGGDIAMTDAVNEGALNEFRRTLETLRENVNTNQKYLLETRTKCSEIDAAMILVKSEAKAFQQKVSNLEVSGTARHIEPREILPEGQSHVPHTDCATKADIERLAVNIKIQDDLLDGLRAAAEKDTENILEEIQSLDQRVDAHFQATSEKLQVIEERTDGQITNLLAQNETQRAKNEAEIKEINETFGRHFASFHTKFSTDVERLDHKVAFVENHLEGHVVAITHQEQRMNNFTTKDFYEKVVHSLVQINPLLFNYTNQLQHCVSEIKAIKDTMRALSAQFEATKQRLAIAAQSPRTVIQDGPSIDPSYNGAIAKSDRSSEGPGFPLATILRDLETHNNDIKKLDQRITNHIETYMAKMGDIKDWTISATQRMAENTDSAGVIMDEIRELRAYLSNMSGSPQTQPAAAAIRWRDEGAIQGLADENGTGQ